MTQADRAMYDAGNVFCETRKALVDLATKKGIKDRVVFMVGRVAWYIDPPKSARNYEHDNGLDGWVISFGSRPEEIEVIE